MELNTTNDTSSVKAVTRCAGSFGLTDRDPGAHAPGFMPSCAPRTVLLKHREIEGPIADYAIRVFPTRPLRFAYMAGPAHLQPVRYLFVDGGYLREAYARFARAWFTNEADKANRELLFQQITVGMRKTFYYDCKDRYPKKQGS